MRYEVSLRRVAQKQLDALLGSDYETIGKAISSLTDSPRPPRGKKLSDSSLWRIRTGEYRIVYSVDDDRKAIIVVRVARHREDTYKGLPNE